MKIVFNLNNYSSSSHRHWLGEKKGAITVIIDTGKKFTNGHRSIVKWLKCKVSNNELADVIDLHRSPETIKQQARYVIDTSAMKRSYADLVRKQDKFVECYFQKLLRPYWWKHDFFSHTVKKEKSRLIYAILATAESSLNTEALAYVLAVNWIEYRPKSNMCLKHYYMSDILLEAVTETLSGRLSDAAYLNWTRLLDPEHVFRVHIDAIKPSTPIQ